MSGVSKTPLVKKLDIKEDYIILLNNNPIHFLSLVGPLPDGVDMVTSAGFEEVDYIHCFFSTVKDLTQNIHRFIPLLKKTGLLWISWPKGNGSIKTDLKRDWIREFVLDLGLVDVKVASVDEDWSALKFVYRTKDR